MLALWWWIDRWRKSTAYMDMTLEQQGAYRNLLDEACLRGGPLPNDERILAKACGDATCWHSVKDAVLSRFTLTAEGWRNHTLDTVIGESQRRAEKQRRYRNSHGNGNGNAHGNKVGNNRRPPDPSPDPSPDQKKRATHVERPKKPADSRVAEFLKWFPEEYKARRNGAEYLVKHAKHGALVKAMLGATDLERLKKYAAIMLKTNDEFITDTDRGIEILDMKFSWLSDKLAAWEVKQKGQGS